MESSTHSPVLLPPGVQAAVVAATGDRNVEPELAWLSWSGTAWRLAGRSGAVFVKRAAELEGERARLDWLEGRWPVPEVVGLFHESGDAWLVTRELAGVPLFHASLGMEPSNAARLFGEILRGLHATDASGCPFGVRARGNVLVHGDYCLPNVLVSAGRMTGIVDVGRAGLGRPDDDLAAGVWSLQYNFGRGFARDFLEAYGWPPMSDQAIEKLRRRYGSGSR
ncbi:MAG TPA: phosphotransferase [Candidatus Dormibacteraeota bacterium]|nr:phosphotransferase [Candidatus Dormibacteraeota bacterium]